MVQPFQVRFSSANCDFCASILVCSCTVFFSSFLKISQKKKSQKVFFILSHFYCWHLFCICYIKIIIKFQKEIHKMCLYPMQICFPIFLLKINITKINLILFVNKTNFIRNNEVFLFLEFIVYKSVCTRCFFLLSQT